jgi:uncharacterized protein YjiS (DUF1127 family)
MFAILPNRLPLGKLAGFFFVPQRGIKLASYRAAERHPSLVSSLTTWRARRAAERELETLSDRALADIGLTRADIPRITAEIH